MFKILILFYRAVSSPSPFGNLSIITSIRKSLLCFFSILLLRNSLNLLKCVSNEFRAQNVEEERGERTIILLATQWCSIAQAVPLPECKHFYPYKLFTHRYIVILLDLSAEVHPLSKLPCWIGLGSLHTDSPNQGEKHCFLLTNSSDVDNCSNQLFTASLWLLPIL